MTASERPLASRCTDDLERGRADPDTIVQQWPRCIWFTGLSGSGKTTLATLLSQRLQAGGCRSCVLDGDRLRSGLSSDLGFSEADRAENVRRVAEVARLMVDAGLVVLVSLISPLRDARLRARELFACGDFFEVHVCTALAECERRDTKALYARARRGELVQFTGIDSPYEAPELPELRLDTQDCAPEANVETLLRALRSASAA